MMETEHMDLLPMSPDHILALIERPELYQQLIGYPAADGLREFYVSGEVSAEFLASLRTLDKPDPWRFGFAIVHKASAMVIGSAGFKGPPDSEGIVEVAYGIVPGFQGRGYATQAASALVDYAFSDERVKVIRAHTLPSSNASTRVLTKCSFRFVGPTVDPEDGPVWQWELARPS